MANTRAEILRLIALLTRQSFSGMLRSKFLTDLDGLSPIRHYKVSRDVRLVGRRWLAPASKSVLTSTYIRKGTSFCARFFHNHADIEIIGDNAPKNRGEYGHIFTITSKEWREKCARFAEVRPNKVRGGLGYVVAFLIKERYGPNNQRNAVTAAEIERIKLHTKRVRARIRTRKWKERRKRQLERAAASSAGAAAPSEDTGSAAAGGSVGSGDGGGDPEGGGGAA